MGSKQGMFDYPNGKDKLLMFAGTLGSMRDGLQIPLMMFVLSNVINRNANPDVRVSLATIIWLSLRLLYVAIGVSVSSNITCSVCSDCLENQESDEEEVRSAILSSASVRDDTAHNENVDDGINKFYDEEKELEIDKGPREMSRSISTNVKNAEKIKNMGLDFSVLIIALVLIGLLIAAILSVHATWYVDQDLDQALSNGRYKSCLHRAVVNKMAPRKSLAIYRVGGHQVLLITLIIFDVSFMAIIDEYGIPL